MSLALGIIAGYVCGITAHEVAHIAAAPLAGVKIKSVRLGNGPRLIRTSWQDVEITIRLLPFSGEVFPANAVTTLTWGYRAFIAAGVAANILLMVVALAMTPELRTMAGRFWAGFLFVQGILIVGSAWPSETISDGLRRRSDGRRLLLSLRGRETSMPHLYQLMLAPYTAQPMDRHQPQVPNESLLALLVKERQMSLSDSAHAAHALLLEENVGSFLSTPERLFLTDKIVTSWLVIDPQGKSKEMDQLTEQAAALGPTLWTIADTRAGVLVEIGRFAEALALIKTLPAPPGAGMLAWRYYYRARAEWALGNTEEAHKLSRLAREELTKQAAVSDLSSAFSARLGKFEDDLKAGKKALAEYY